MPQPRLANRCLYPVKVKQNFDWSETNKKLVIFSLNFKRSNLIETVIKNFNTSISCTDWIHIIGNDGVEEDFQHLYKHNVRFFTIFRDNTVERNGSFLRNYFIKRCQSKLLLQKDAEVVLLDDPVKNCIEFGKPWRPGWVYPLSESHTKFYLLNGSLDVKGKLQPSGTTPQYNMHGYPNKIVDFGKYSAEFAKNNIIKAAGGFCISLRLLYRNSCLRINERLR